MDFKKSEQNTQHVEKLPDSTQNDRKADHLIDEALAVKTLDENVDYSGAAKKLDPVEIRLVQKLDWYIMPTYDTFALGST